MEDVVFLTGAFKLLLTEQYIWLGERPSVSPVPTLQLHQDQTEIYYSQI